MSTVLWANMLVNGLVESDQADKYALYRQIDRLDRLCRDSGLIPLSSICDSTDMRVNVEELEIPDGMNSTDELMAREGIWIDAGSAVDLLSKLLTKIRSEKTRFGVLRDMHADVVSELEESLAFAEQAEAKSAKFNFAMVT